jgi:hypothetical protein
LEHCASFGGINMRRRLHEPFPGNWFFQFRWWIGSERVILVPTKKPSILPDVLAVQSHLSNLEKMMLGEIVKDSYDLELSRLKIIYTSKDS